MYYFSLGPDDKIYFKFYNSENGLLTYKWIDNPEDSIHKIHLSANEINWKRRGKDIYSYAPAYDFRISYPQTIDFDYTLKCDGIGLRCTSDERFDDAAWYIVNADSSIVDTVYGYNSFYKWKDTGTYLVTMECRTPHKYRRWKTKEVKITELILAGLSLSTDELCEHTALQCTNLTYHPGHDTANVRYRWDFGDGEISTERSAVHIYRKNGDFEVSLVASANGCADTVVYGQHIRILPAPDPRMNVDKTSGCTPLTVTYTGKADTLIIYEVFYSGAGDSSLTSGNFTYTQAGTYKLLHLTYSANGCITKDSAIIKVFPGLQAGAMIQGPYASFKNNDTVSLHWDKLQGAATYTLQYSEDSLNWKTLSKTLKDTFYDHDIPWSLAYRISATDSCGNKSLPALIRPIWLRGTPGATNAEAWLDWSFYPGNNYCVERLQEGKWLQIYCGKARSITDNNFGDLAGPYALQRCYRISTADEPKAYSNTACVKFLPQVFVPNAFSPNGDGLNETWNWPAMGLTEFTLQVYNRWGTRIYTTKDASVGWDGANAPEGVYIYQLIYRDGEQNLNYIKGNVTLIR